MIVYFNLELISFDILKIVYTKIKRGRIFNKISEDSERFILVIQLNEK